MHKEQTLATGSNQKRTLIDKLDELPPERVAEVEDFVDFLRSRDQNHRFTLAATKTSETSFRKAWESPDDAAYNAL